MNIQEGDILLSHTHYVGKNFIGKGFIPWAIRKVTGSYWNHAAIVIRVYGTLCILEADARGFNVTKTLHNWLRESKSGYRDYAVVRTNSFIKERVFDIINAKYDIKGLLIDQIIFFVGVLISKLINKIGKIFKQDWKIKLNWYFGHTGNFAKENVYCSEGVLYLTGDVDFYKKTPADIAKEHKLIFTYYNKL